MIDRIIQEDQAVLTPASIEKPKSYTPITNDEINELLNTGAKPKDLSRKKTAEKVLKDARIEAKEMLKEAIKRKKEKKRSDYKEGDYMDADYNGYTEGTGVNLRNYGYVKPLDPKRMLITLPALLAQIYAGYNSRAFIDETKRILDSLYHSRMITDTVYNHLANI